MSNALIDRAVLDDLFAHIGVDAAPSVIDLFLGEARDYVARIGAASTDAVGRETARRAAHSLKSSAGQIGASALATIAERIEHTAEKGGDFSEFVGALQKCTKETDAVLIELLSGRG